MAEGIVSKTQLTANSNVEIPWPDPATAESTYVLVFDGDAANDLYLVQSATDTDADGPKVPAGELWESGPYRGASDTKPTHIYAAASTTFYLTIMRDQ